MKRFRIRRAGTGAALGGRAAQTGILIAAANVPRTFQRTLMPRSVSDQGIATGLSTGIDYAAASLIQDAIEAIAMLATHSRKTDVADDIKWRRLTLALDVAAIGAGLSIQSAFRHRDGEHLSRGAARATGYWLSLGAFGGAVIGAAQELLGAAEASSLPTGKIRSFPVAIPAAAVIASLVDLDRRRREKADTEAQAQGDISGAGSGVKSLGMGLGVASSLVAISTGERLLASAVGTGLAAVLPGSARVWRPVGHGVSLAGLGGAVWYGMHRAYSQVEGGEKKMEPAFDEPPESPLVSGGPDSLVDFATLSKQGRRFVATVLRPDWIRGAMGVEATAVPIRVFIGLDSAPTEEDRVALAMAELERTGAWDREILMLISPTGTGYVNYVAVEAVEYFAHGNSAAVAMQYSQRPSVMSLDKVWEGRHHARMLDAAVHERLQAIPPEKRPRVVLFGESLGAHTSQDAFMHKGTDGLVSDGIDAAIWIGTPYASKWKDQVLGDDRSDVDRSLIGVFDNFGEVEALDKSARDRICFVMITHDNDAVARFGLDLLVSAPPWLDTDRSKRPGVVPRSERWSTPTSFILTLVDMKNSANVIPGQFEAKGHDYRADLARFIREFYGFGATDSQLAAVEAALRSNELRRKEWIDAKDGSSKKAESPGPEVVAPESPGPEVVGPESPGPEVTTRDDDDAEPATEPGDLTSDA